MTASVIPPPKRAVEPSTHFDSRKVLSDIITEPSFEGEQRAYTRTLAIGRAAGRLAELETEQAPDKESTLRNLYSIVSKVPGFIEGNTTMRRHTPSHKLPRIEMQEAKKRLVEFNHAIKYLLDSDPTLTTTEVSGFLSDVYQEMHEDETNERATEFRDSCEQVLRGMQHEIFAKNIIDSLTPEFTANGEVSIEDDLRGVDIFVTYKGVRFPVDIKASTFHVREKRKNSLNPKHIIWSGIHARDVGDRFRLTTQEIAQAKGYMRTALREAYVEYMVRAQIMGRAVVERPQAASALKVQHSVRPPSKPETRPVQQEVVDSKEVATILARYFAPIRELSRANKEAQRNTLAQVLYQRIYPTFSEYLDTLEAESSPIEIREKLCRMCIKEYKVPASEEPELRKLIWKFVREYQLRAYIATKHPGTLVLPHDYNKGYDVKIGGKQHNLQGGLRSLVSEDVSSGYMPNDIGSLRKRLRTL